MTQIHTRKIRTSLYSKRRTRLKATKVKLTTKRALLMRLMS